MTEQQTELWTASINDEIKDKIELPKEFRKKWLEALRSGDFGQIQSALADGDNNYCCLGVACKAAGYSDYHLRQLNSETNTAKTPSGRKTSFAGYISNGDHTFNLKKVPEVLHGDHGLPEKLADFNDEGYSFSAIANFVQRNTIGV